MIPVSKRAGNIFYTSPAIYVFSANKLLTWIVLRFMQAQIPVLNLCHQQYAWNLSYQHNGPFLQEHFSIIIDRLHNPYIGIRTLWLATDLSIPAGFATGAMENHLSPPVINIKVFNALNACSKRP